MLNSFMRKIIIYRSYPYSFETQDTKKEVHIPFEQIQYWIRSGHIFKHLFRYQYAEIHTYDLQLISKPFLSSLMIWCFSWSSATRRDTKGRVEKITFRFLLALFFRMVRDHLKTGKLLCEVERR